MKNWLWLGGLALLAGCTGMPRGVEPVSGFELESYLGHWYEIARLDHRFERGLDKVSAHYARRPQGGVAVINRGYATATGQWKEAHGRAYFIGDPTIGRLKVSFFGPFFGSYNIIALDHEHYEYALVCGPSRKYLWILARRPDLDPAVRKALVERAAELGFATEELIYPRHQPVAKMSDWPQQ